MSSRSAGDIAWAARIGPVLSEDDVAELLGIPVDEVRQATELLRLRNRDGGQVYPVLQFDGR